MAKWLTKPCEVCGSPVAYQENWPKQAVQASCKTCRISNINLVEVLRYIHRNTAENSIPIELMECFGAQGGKLLMDSDGRLDSRLISRVKTKIRNLARAKYSLSQLQRQVIEDKFLFRLVIETQKWFDKEACAAIEGLDKQIYVTSAQPIQGGGCSSK